MRGRWQRLKQKEITKSPQGKEEVIIDKPVVQNGNQTPTSIRNNPAIKKIHDYFQFMPKESNQNNIVESKSIDV